MVASWCEIVFDGGDIFIDGGEVAFFRGVCGGGGVDVATGGWG